MQKHFVKQQVKLRADAPAWVPKKKEIKLARIKIEMPDTITDKESYNIMGMVKRDKLDEVRMIINRFNDNEREWILNSFTHKELSLIHI